MFDPKQNTKAYLDQELSAQERAEFEAALANDPSLDQELSDFSKISSSLKAHMTASEPVGKEVTMKAVQPRSFLNFGAISFFRTRQFRWALGTVGVAFIAVLINNGIFAQAKIGKNEMRAADAVASKVAPSASAESEAKDQLKSDSAEKVAAPVMQGHEDVARSPMESGQNAKAEVASPSAAKSADMETRSKGGIAVPSQPQSGKRAMITDLEIALLVNDPIKEARRAENTVKSVGGWTLNISTSQEQGAYTVSTLVLKVPTTKLDEVVEDLKDMGEIKSQHKNGQDVQDQIVDMDSRMKNLKIQEESLRNTLKEARRMGSILEIKDRLQEVRSEIEGLAGQLKNIHNAADFSTLTLRLEERSGAKLTSDGSGNWSKDSWGAALDSLGAFGKTIGVFFINVLVFSPIWLPICLISWLVYRKTTPKA